MSYRVFFVDGSYKDLFDIDCIEMTTTHFYFMSAVDAFYYPIKSVFGFRSYEV